MLTWVPAMESAGSAVPSGWKISCPMYFPELLSQILGMNLLAEYITSYSSIFVVKAKIFHHFIVCMCVFKSIA